MQALTRVAVANRIAEATQTPDTLENSRSCWCTPDALYGLLYREFHFNLDGAADESNTKCARWLERVGTNSSPICYATRGCIGDAFSYRPQTGHAPHDVIFVNPPYSGAKYGEQPLLDWCRLFVKWRIQGANVVALLPASTSERWFEFAAEHADHVRLLTPRVKFDPPPGVQASSNAGGNAVFVFDGVERNSKIVVWNWRNGLYGGAA